MEIIINFIIGLVIGILIFFIAINWFLKTQVKDMEQEFMNNFLIMQKAIEEKAIRMKVEKIQDEYFAYDIDRNEQFVCRGKTPKKLMEHFSSMYSDRLPVVMPEYWEMMGMKMEQIVKIGTKGKDGKEKIHGKFS